MTIELRYVALLLIALVSVTLGSCGDSRDDQAGLTVLHRGLSSDPETLDPQKGRSVQAADVLRDIGEGLVGYTANGDIVPAAADSWEISKDGLTYVFHIRRDARWSNGEPLTAGHFVLGLRRLVDPATAAFYAAAVVDIVNAEDIIAGERPPSELGVVAADKRTLLISLARPVPYLLGLLAHPSTFPAHPGTIDEQGKVGAAAAGRLSNGAYKVERWEVGAKLELRRNKYYWNNANTAIDAVHHHVVTQEMAELNRYRAGELHITSTVPPENFEQIKEEYADELRVAPSLGVYYYGFNLTKPPFKDSPELRQALSMAIDRDVLVSKFTGRGEIAAYGWVPPGVDNYESPRLDHAALAREDRIEIAQRLYRDAGYSEGKPAQVELRYNTSDTQERIALAVQSMWREVLGLEVKLINEEFQVLLSNISDRQVTQVFRSSWIGDYDDANTFLSILIAGNPANQPAFDNEEFDALMEAAGRQSDLDRRRQYLQKAERVMLAQHPVIPLYFYVSKHLISSAVRGWGDNVLDYHYSQHLSLSAGD